MMKIQAMVLWDIILYDDVMVSQPRRPRLE